MERKNSYVKERKELFNTFNNWVNYLYVDDVLDYCEPYLRIIDMFRTEPFALRTNENGILVLNHDLEYAGDDQIQFRADCIVRFLLDKNSKCSVCGELKDNSLIES